MIRGFSIPTNFGRRSRHCHLGGDPALRTFPLPRHAKSAGVRTRPDRGINGSRNADPETVSNGDEPDPKRPDSWPDPFGDPMRSMRLRRTSWARETRSRKAPGPRPLCNERGRDPVALGTCSLPPRSAFRNVSRNPPWAPARGDRGGREPRARNPPRLPVARGHLRRCRGRRSPSTRSRRTGCPVSTFREKRRLRTSEGPSRRREGPSLVRSGSAISTWPGRPPGRRPAPRAGCRPPGAPARTPP